MEAAPDLRPSVANGAQASAPYDRRRPSPPFIHIPPHGTTTSGEPMAGLMPSYENVGSTQLTRHDLEIITQNAIQIAQDRSSDWSYEQRRRAQPLLDFLYLGPNSVIRDLAFLEHAGITLIMVVRDSRMTNTRLASLDKARRALNIQHHYVDFQGNEQLIGMFPGVIRIINDHLLSIHHTGAGGTNARRGKVLIACETGNERSATLAAAYIMAMFNADMITTLQFISVQRFCCCLDEDVKRKLQCWEDLLHAQSQVAAQNRSVEGTQHLPSNVQHAKRHIDEVVGMSQELVTDQDMDMTDEDRFTGRAAFVPFVSQ
jgi:serine/threonine/tyrosine-interacting protein